VSHGLLGPHTSDTSRLLFAGDAENLWAWDDRRIGTPLANTGGEPALLQPAQVKTMLTRLLREESGQDLAEYGIALAIVAIASASAALSIGADVKVLWSRALQSIIIAVLG
jgi:Flp pilus assembly pilin Flp